MLTFSLNEKEGLFMLQHNVLVSTLVLACAIPTMSLGASMPGKIAPSKVEIIGDTGLKRITLTEQAAHRIGVATTNVLEESVYRTRKIRGEVTELGVTDVAGVVTGAVSVNGLQQTEVDCERDVRFVPLSEYDWSQSFSAQMSNVLLASGVEATSINYLFESRTDTLTLGTQVLVEICIAETAGQATVIPHNALLYSAEGKTWVYTEESPRTYVRAPVDVAWIDGARVILKNGPPVGSAIVTTGSVELFGEEFGIGH
jgi:hypothetical protein